MCIQQTVQHLTAKRGARSVPLELQETSTEIKAKKQKKGCLRETIAVSDADFFKHWLYSLLHPRWCTFKATCSNYSLHCWLLLLHNRPCFLKWSLKNTLTMLSFQQHSDAWALTVWTESRVIRYFCWITKVWKNEIICSAAEAPLSLTTHYCFLILSAHIAKTDMHLVASS